MGAAFLGHTRMAQRGQACSVLRPVMSWELALSALLEAHSVVADICLPQARFTGTEELLSDEVTRLGTSALLQTQPWPISSAPRVLGLVPELTPMCTDGPFFQSSLGIKINFNFARLQP